MGGNDLEVYGAILSSIDINFFASLMFIHAPSLPPCLENRNHNTYSYSLFAILKWF